MPVEGLVSTRIYPTELEILAPEKILTPGDKIEGIATFWNYEDFIVPDLKLRIELLTPQDFIGWRETHEIFSIAPKDKITREFFYNIPSHAPAGESTLRVQLTNSRGEELSWIDQNIKIQSSDQFIHLSNFYFEKEEELIHPGSGTVYQPLEEPTIIFEGENKFTQEIDAYPAVRIHRRSLGSVVEEKAYDNISFSAQGPGNHQLLLPAIIQPGSYLAEVSLYDVETKRPISNTILYRWVVSGRSARIISLSADRYLYPRNAEALIKIQFAGAADHNIPLQQGTVQIVAHDQEDKVVGQTRKTDVILLGGKELVIPLLIEENVVNPNIVASIQSGGVTLDEYAVSIRQDYRERIPTTQEWWYRYQEELILIIAVLIVLLMLALYFRPRKKDEEDEE